MVKCFLFLLLHTQNNYVISSGHLVTPLGSASGLTCMLPLMNHYEMNGALSNLV